MGLNERSKFIALILRHKPETIGITLDENFSKTNQLCS